MTEGISSKKNNYELVFHLNPNMQRESLNEKLGQIKNEISALGGLITKFRETQKIKLAYPIKKNMISNFGIIEFIAPKETVSDLNNKLKIDNDFLRYMIIKKEEETLKPRKEYAPRIKKEKPKEEVKVESKEIEKKLEEILEKL